jgi:anti-sigma B factor antagonist
MKIKTTARGGVTVLSLDGNLLGGPDATALNAKLHEMLEADRKQIVLDLSSVRVMNSSGLGLLIAGVSAVKTAGGRLTIAGASTKLSSVFAVSRVGPLLETYPSVEAAAKSYAT